MSNVMTKEFLEPQGVLFEHSTGQTTSTEKLDACAVCTITIRYSISNIRRASQICNISRPRAASGFNFSYADSVVEFTALLPCSKMVRRGQHNHICA